jgi:GrpB-like predicted nucleotidyltransferase (UPF0157 family)
MSNLICLVGYYDSWPKLFEKEAERIRAVLGEKAVRVEHVGSTSVPGLIAKPVIDLLLVVPDSSCEDEYLPPLEVAGYRLKFREPDWFEHRFLKGPDTDINLHVLSQYCEEIDRMVMFRDWLRRNAADRELYARTKVALASQEWPSIQSYADAKTQVVREILSRAYGQGTDG